MAGLPQLMLLTWDALQPAMLGGTALKWGDAITPSTGALWFWRWGTHPEAPRQRKSHTQCRTGCPIPLSIPRALPVTHGLQGGSLTGS